VSSVSRRRLGVFVHAEGAVVELLCCSPCPCGAQQPREGWRQGTNEQAHHGRSLDRLLFSSDVIRELLDDLNWQWAFCNERIAPAYVYIMRQAMWMLLLLGYWPIAWQVRVYTEGREPLAPFQESPIRGLFVLLSKCFPMLHD
jgi:hypothetical protein